MDKIEVAWCYFITTCLSFFGYIFTGSETYVKFLCLCVCVDIITGVISAGFSKKISSRGFFGNISKGLVRKMLMLLLLVMVSYGSVISNMIWARDALLVFYIGGECISILENLDKCGVPFPQFLKELFEQMRDKGDMGNNIEDNNK